MWIAVDNQGTDDPAINLAIEEFLVREADRRESFFFPYINRSAVILGKHQNVLAEVNLKYCWENGIQVVRRISGGGAVYHDYGNLNLSFITAYSFKQFNRYRQFLQPVVEVVQSLGVDLEIDERNNLRVAGKKVSGNAQFSSRGRMLSHGTLLVNTELSKLKNSLQHTIEKEVSTKATASVRSAVANLSGFLPDGVETTILRKMLIKQFSGENVVWRHFSEQEWQTINQLAEEKYRSWQWTIARSPVARFKKNVYTENGPITIQFTLENGHFIRMRISDRRFRFLTNWLNGMALKQENWEALKARVKNELPEKWQNVTLDIVNGLIS